MSRAASRVCRTARPSPAMLGCHRSPAPPPLGGGTPRTRVGQMLDLPRHGGQGGQRRQQDAIGQARGSGGHAAELEESRAPGAGCGESGSSLRRQTLLLRDSSLMCSRSRRALPSPATLTMRRLRREDLPAVLTFRASARPVPATEIRRHEGGEGGQQPVVVCGRAGPARSTGFHRRCRGSRTAPDGSAATPGSAGGPGRCSCHPALRVWPACSRRSAIHRGLEDHIQHEVLAKAGHIAGMEDPSSGSGPY